MRFHTAFLLYWRQGDVPLRAAVILAVQCRARTLQQTLHESQADAFGTWALEAAAVIGDGHNWPMSPIPASSDQADGDPPEPAACERVFGRVRDQLVHHHREC